MPDRWTIKVVDIEAINATAAGERRRSECGSGASTRQPTFAAPTRDFDRELRRRFEALMTKSPVRRFYGLTGFEHQETRRSDGNA
jgi:hypothetical protein